MQGVAHAVETPDELSLVADDGEHPSVHPGHHAHAHLDTGYCRYYCDVAIATDILCLHCVDNVYVFGRYCVDIS